MFCLVLVFGGFGFGFGLVRNVCFLWWKSDGRRQGKTRKREKGKKKVGGALPYISWGRYARDLKVTYLPTYLLG